MDERVYTKLGYDAVRQMLAGCTLSAPGREAALALVPETEESAADALLEEAKEAEHGILAAPSLPVTSFDDVKNELTRLRLGVSLSCGELLRVCLLHKAARRTARGIREDLPRLYAMAKDLWYDEELISRIDMSILGEDKIADNASPALRDIRRRIRRENAAVQEKLNAIIRSKEQAAYLQDAIITSRDGRFVVPVKQECRNNVPGLIHGQSASGATLFIEPMGIVESNNELRLLEEEERREIERILAALSDRARGGAGALAADLKTLTYLDVVFAKAALGIKMKGFAPTFNRENKIDIRAGRHPLIDKDKVIPVSVSVSEDIRTLIITGPNTGGKTVTLKLVGLFSLMAQSGLFLPAAEGTTLPVYTDVFADIGDEQSIEQSLSTFSAHMRNIIYILRKAGRDSLVLLDELGAGTDPAEGTALALSILDKLYEKGARVFATTHYGEIKAYAMTTKGFENAGMEFDPDSLQPTFHLIMGLAGASNAFLISRRLGLKQDVIEKAKGFMQKERLEFDSLLRHAERTRKDAEARLEKARLAEREAAEAGKKAKALEEDLAARRRTAIKKAQEEAYEIVRKTQDEMEEILREARRTRDQSVRESTETTKTLRTRVSGKKDVLRRQLEPARLPAQPVDADSLALGEPVHVASLAVDGTVASLPDSRGMVEIQAGILKVSVPVSDLEKREGGGKKPRRTSSVRLARKTVPLSLNLHGYNVEEAILEIDKYLDDAFLSGLLEVSIIHGKGTGALRSGVQKYLRHHPHVASFRMGKLDEGAEGVTIVTLK